VDALRWVEELINTRSLEFGTDDIAGAAGLAAWLYDRDLLPRRVRVDDGHVRKAAIVREGLRALVARNTFEEAALTATQAAADEASLEALAALAADLPLVLDVMVQPPRLAPATGHPVDDALARILEAVPASAAAGTWGRMKVCRQPYCRWAYYDESRNRSRAWCSMDTCGNRAKARSFRQRH
jgi:predicted RNA-binding Zn ribbon-like protein